MEMPTPCSACGTVVELNDMHAATGGTRLICPPCYEDDENDEECSTCGRVLNKHGRCSACDSAWIWSTP